MKWKTVWITTRNKSLGCDLYRLKLIIPKFRRHLYAVLRCCSIWERSFPGNRNHHAKTTTVIATRQYWYVLVGMVSFEEVIKIFHYWLWDPATRHIHPPGHILLTYKQEQQNSSSAKKLHGNLSETMKGTENCHRAPNIIRINSQIGCK